MPVEQFLLHHKHYTWRCQIKPIRNWWVLKLGWIVPQWTAMGLAEANLRRLCSVCIGGEEYSLWCTYIHIHELYTYMWWKRFRQEHQNCPQMLEVGVFFFLFHSEQVHNAYDLACSVLLVFSGEIWPCSFSCPGLTRYLEIITPVHKVEMLKSFLNPHTFLHYLFMDQ